MSEFGKFTQINFVNGTTPAINDANLNELERVAAITDQELARSQNYRFKQIKDYCWALNCKTINLFNLTTDWSIVGTCTISSTSSPKSGDDDVAIVESDNSAGTIGMYGSVSSLDLTTFNDSTTSSSTDDIITLSTYISDLALFDDITVILGDDVSNNYSKQFTISGTGYDRVTFSAKKSAFTTNGTPSGWDSIGYIRIEATTQASAQNEFISFHCLMLYRNDPDNDGYPQPLQQYTGSAWENIFDQETPNWLMYLDPNINEIGIQKFDDLNDADNFDTLHIHCSVIDFLWETVMYCKATDYTTVMTWYVDSNNYAIAYYYFYDFYLTVVEAGTPTTQTFYIVYDMLIDERFIMRLEKNGDTIRASLEKNYNCIAYLEHETSISSSSDGCLYYGHKAIGNSYIVDWKVSNVNDLNIDDWTKPKIVIKLEDETIDTDDTLSADNELFALLPPSSMFIVEAHIVAVADSTTPDIKIDWTTIGIDMITNRQSIGPYTGTTNVNNTSVKMSDYGIGSDIDYGLVSSDESVIFEKFIIKTGVSGGFLAIRWAQQTSSADEITVKAGSNILFTKIEQLMQNKNN